MGILSVAVSVVFLVYLLLRISGMVGGTTTRTTIVEERYDHRPKLSDLSEAEIQSQYAMMPTDWVIYQGMSPPLQLKVRGLTEELYRRVMRRHLDAFGQDTLERMPMPEKLARTGSGSLTTV